MENLPGITMVNGIYLTNEAIESIDYLQTGGTINWGVAAANREFSNTSLQNAINEIEELNTYFVELMVNDGDETAWLNGGGTVILTGVPDTKISLQGSSKTK